MRRLAVAAIVTVALGGCDVVLTGLVEESHIGALGYPDHLHIVVPEQVGVGQEFTVEVGTWGADGCWRKDRTDVRVNGLSATITPYDEYRREGGAVCTTGPVQILHTGTLAFEQAGTGQITIQGSDATVTRSVVVE